MNSEPEVYDPNRSTSVPLVEVRTVLSRARTAIEVIEGATEFETVRGTWGLNPETGGYELLGRETIPHPEHTEMLAALRGFVAAAARWEKHGSKRRGAR